VLERLSGSLCDAVTGREDGQERLEEADRSGLFVVQLDDVRGWWRYHHLFADLLRARLRTDPERSRRLHHNAARWYEQRGLPDEAIRHALAAGEQERAARLVEENFDTVFNLRGEQATIGSWLPALSADLVRSRPRLLLAQAQMASMQGDLGVMEPLLDAAEKVIERADEEPLVPSTGPEGSLLVNARAMLALQRSYAAQLRGDANATATMTRKAMEYLNENELMLLSAVQGFQAMVDWLRGQLRTPGPRSSPASSGGVGTDRSPPRPGDTTAWPGCSEARGGSTRRSGRASGRWRPPRSRDGAGRPPPDPRWSGWPTSPISAMIWTRRRSTWTRGYGSAVSSCTPRPWPRGW
jgi:LuxR family maltose regulon positive regulatory protein